MDKEKVYVVKNRSAGIVTYRIPESNIRREFAPGEPKKISLEELEKLTFQPGGREILASFLQVQNEEATEELGVRTEPEYFMSEQDVVELIKNGSQDAFLDALDYAPKGVLDLIKKFAVSLPMQDSAKREAVKEKLGFDVDAAIKNDRADKATEGAAGGKTTERRVKTETTAPARRTSGSNYKVVSTGK